MTFFPSSLGGRFAVTALAVLVLLSAVAMYAEQTVSGNASETREVMEEYSALRAQLDTLQPPLRSAESLTYRYAISLDPRFSRQVIAQLQRARAKAATLANNPLASEDGEFRESVVEFVGVLKELERQIRNLLGIIGDVRRRFPGMDLLTDGMSPLSDSFLGATSVALDETRENDDKGPGQWRVYDLLSSVRYTWLQQISTFRLFVADRSGVFGDPDETSENSLVNLRSFSKRIDELLDELETLSAEGSLDFQQTAMIAVMRDAWSRWSKAAEEATQIYASDSWRADLPALRDSVTPLLDRSWGLVAKMTTRLDGRARRNIEDATTTSRLLSRFIWTFVGLVYVALGLGWLLFERVIRRPLLTVAQAMEEEARVGQAIELKKVGLRETDTLINAFLLMRGQVRSRQLRIESILENAGDGIITIDEQGNIETFNKAAQEIFGFGSNEAVGHNVSLLMPEPYASEHHDYLERYLREGTRHVLGRTVDVTGLREDGSVFPLELQISELQLDDRRLFIGMTRDISERKEAEEAIHQAKAAAEDAREDAQRKATKLASSLNELRQAQTQLVESEKMASLGGLVAGIAHEINTPVGIGVTAASSLQERVTALREAFDAKTMKRSDLQRFLDGAKEGTGILLGNLQRAAELVRSFKQVAVDQTSDSQRRFNMCDYLDEVLLNLRPTLKKTKHEVRVDCPPNLEVTSYPGSLSQVLTNLVTNSLIHGFEDQPAGHIDIKVETRGERLLFEYRDDGKGIPPDHLDKVFEPFFTTRRGQGGSGLGLHVVYNIVKQHLRGDIRCSSEPGKGTTFTIDIPYEA